MHTSDFQEQVDRSRGERGPAIDSMNVARRCMKTSSMNTTHHFRDNSDFRGLKKHLSDFFVMCEPENADNMAAMVYSKMDYGRTAILPLVALLSASAIGVVLAGLRIERT